MRNSDPTSNRFLAPTTCYLDPTGMTYVAIGAAIIGAVTSGVSMIAQQSAASQAAANAQAVANYNAQIQQQNAQVQYQIQVQQAQYTQQAAQANQMLAKYNADAAMAQGAALEQAARSQAASERQFYEYSKSVSLANAASQQQRYEAQLQQAKALEQEGEARRAQSREEARRLREENETRISMIRGKYAASGVAFEGSPLVVLSDAARLAETAVQDQAYVGELEARKQFRSGELQRFEAGFTLLEKANFEQEAYAADISIFNSQNAANISVFNAQNQAATQAYESNILALNYENQILAATYDTYIADAERKMALSQASLTRLGGEVEASNIRSQSTANMVGGIANIASSIGSAAYNISSMPRTPRAPRTSPGIRR